MEKITHHEEYRQWFLVEKGVIEDICHDCVRYFLGTDYCELNKFEGDEKFGERLPVTECLYYINEELYNLLYGKNEN